MLRQVRPSGRDRRPGEPEGRFSWGRFQSLGLEPKRRPGVVLLGGVEGLMWGHLCRSGGLQERGGEPSRIREPLGQGWFHGLQVLWPWKAGQAPRTVWEARDQEGEQAWQGFEGGRGM